MHLFMTVTRLPVDQYAMRFARKREESWYIHQNESIMEIISISKSNIMTLLEKTLDSSGAALKCTNILA